MEERKSSVKVYFLGLAIVRIEGQPFLKIILELGGDRRFVYVNFSNVLSISNHSSLGNNSVKVQFSKGIIDLRLYEMNAADQYELFYTGKNGYCFRNIEGKLDDSIKKLLFDET
ncbi:MAG: hypothetical protein F6K40_12415 [Okeania sp. SIO3I5]|uniref:hypothetical protein n=1 Tax=Okeania sp. SIO3I5 TaxID=2607805 RepID=UPI0013BBE5C3|nr:hypothetical protein [Okeania sp. SIO3I5]NEQ37033.1 hypothetical protein [Okeania sp. SIO3I5]